MEDPIFWLLTFCNHVAKPKRETKIGTKLNTSTAPHAMNPWNVDNTTTFGALTDLGFCAGGELRGGVNPLRD